MLIFILTKYIWGAILRPVMRIQHKIRSSVKDAKVFLNPFLRHKLGSRDWRGILMSASTGMDSFMDCCRGVMLELLGKDWSLCLYDFEDATIGECRNKTMEIALSRTFVEDCERAVCWDYAVKAFLHELAHALESKHFNTGGHDDRWQFFCNYLGIGGEECNQVLDLYDARWSFECFLVYPDEGKVLCGFWKKPKDDASKWVIDGRPETQGRLAFMTRGEIIRLQLNKPVEEAR